MFLELEQIKKHLNIDSDFTDDDEYLIHLAEVAEMVVEKHIDDKLQCLANRNGGDLPSPLLHATLLFIGNLYQSRESVAYTNAVEIPLSYSYLLDLYKNYLYYEGRTTK